MSLNRSILATALTGASGAGGTLIYHHAVPWTWKEVLIKEGCYFLDAENEYKAVWSEHKTTSLEKIEELKSVQQTFVKDTIKNWCESQLKNNYVKNSTSYTHISNLCTSKGITTVKAKLILSGYSDFIEDETNNKDKLYKAVFGIYRYHTPFIDWLKEFNKDTTVTQDQLKAEAVVDTGRKALKSVCELELKRPYAEVTDIKHYTYLSWWCKKLPYEKVGDLIKAKNEGWELAEEWTGKADKWKHTTYVESKIPKSDGKKEIEDLNVKQWCTSNHDLELYQNDAYMQTYRIVKYVCKKEKPKS